MAATLSPEEAAARVHSVDSIGIPLGTGQPPAFIEALGGRDDWEELRIGGALLLAWSEAFKHPNVHYLSGFFGPVERALRDQGANISFVPADFRRFARLLVVEVSERFPTTFGLPPDYLHAVHAEQADVLVESDRAPFVLEDPPPTEADRAIAEHASRFIPEGATLQTGIGSVPSTLAGLLAEGDGGDYGIHSEMFTSGLMLLHEAGKVTNRKGQFEGISVATFAAGTERLYEWLDGNQDVAFLPVEVVNSQDVIARNRDMITINGALAIDVQGQVVADTIAANQFSGIGGHEDFISGPALSLEARALLC